jgi:hypothetical protein
VDDRRQRVDDRRLDNDPVAEPWRARRVSIFSHVCHLTES